MKIKISFLLQIVFLFLIVNFIQAQKNIKTESILENPLTFNSVKNDFIYDIKLPEKLYFSSSIGISVDVKNTGKNTFRLEANLNDDPWQNSTIIVKSGKQKTLQVIIQRRLENDKTIFPGMHGIPGGAMRTNVKPPKTDAGIEKITIKVFSKGNVSFTISEIKPFGEFISVQKISENSGFFPFIDEFGQYKHTSWKEKTVADSSLKQAIKNENSTLKLMPEPNGRNSFGGWKDGPRLKATGNFRTEKLNGKWWLVDPDGCLFWSQGITCINFLGALTPISNRTNFFENLPDRNGPMGEFYSIGKNGDTFFNYTQANLFRKYGQQWKEKATENTLKRLKSWGINSFGNWSDPNIYLSVENRIPYTVGIKSANFPNVFDPSFRESVKKSLLSLDAKIKDDPYCIGFFIDNEIDMYRITARLLMQSGDGKSGLPFFDYLKSKYTSIENLNKNWKTTYSNWQQVETITKLPVSAKIDIQIFDLKILDEYYKICREELKSFAPNKLYFGSRLHCHYYPDDQSEVKIIEVAAKYCDVVCFNRYRFSAEELILPFGIDKPTLIGEFHFGTLDRGMLHVGLRGVANQNQRAETYSSYVEGALNNPQIVGTHWFQYCDQAISGRVDGENYQIGFVDVCDNPYPEIVDAARKIGNKMYKIRYGK